MMSLVCVRHFLKIIVEIIFDLNYNIILLTGINDNDGSFGSG